MLNIKRIPSIVEKQLGWRPLKAIPVFLRKYQWTPKLIFFEPKHKIYIAVDLVFNQQLSLKIYEKEAFVALKKNKNLCICIFVSSSDSFDFLKVFCKRNRIGLKIYSSYGINTVVPLSFEKIIKIKSVKVKKRGWFPRVILDKAKLVNKISLAKLIKGFAGELEKNKTEERQLQIIKKYIDKILQSQPDFIGNSVLFKTLLNFEYILKFSNIDNRDHVFHSARVFLVGCIIIDKFYNEFKQYYKDIFPGIRKINLEYMWLLTALFHDIGRVKQKGYYIYKKDKEKNVELMNGIEKEMRKVWKDQDYQLTLGNVVTLIKHCCLKKEDRDPFTGCDMNDDVDPGIRTVLTESYNKCISHGVISCFELVPDLLKRIRATSRKTNNTFLKYHIFPAAVAVALHDWTIWEEMRRIKVFPISLENFPIAALLIYIDTWDDYKRSSETKISIDNIDFTDKSVIVYITWYKNVDYLEEKRKYVSFEKNVIYSGIKFKIKVSNEQ